ncbi:MAG: V-type ATP synthase subunit F [Candidatus Micrarchaeia archaeon]
MPKVKIIAIGEPNLVTGLTLAGLENSRIATSENFQKIFEEFLSNKEFGVIVVQEDMLSSIDWRLKKKLDLIAYPVIVPVPGISGKSTESDDLRNLIKRALGFDMMMNNK